MDNVAIIPLTQNKYAIIDIEDLELVGKYKWYANKSRGAFYAITCSDKTHRHLKLHRLITNAKKGEYVDHINRNSLDNRKRNLRICSNAQNCRNRRKTNKTTTSRFKGVSFYPRYNKWVAQLGINYKRVNIGYYDSEEEAAKVYNLYAARYFGEFSSLNQIENFDEANKWLRGEKHG